MVTSLAIAATGAAGGNAGTTVSRRRFLRLAGVGSVAAMSGGLLAGCEAGTLGQGRPGDLRIGFLSVAGNPEAVRTATCLNCLNLAVEEVNASGGIAGRRVAVTRETVSADARAGADRVAQLMRRDPLDVVITRLTDQQRRVLAPSLPALNLLVLDPSPRGDVGCSRYLVSTGQVPSQQVQPLARWVLQNAGTRIYAVRSDDSWSRAAVDSLKNGLSGTRAQLATSVPLAGAQDMRLLVQSIRQANPDVVWCLLPKPADERFAQALSESDVHSLVVMNAWDELSATAHPSLVAGAITCQPWFMSVTTPESKAFLRAYGSRYGAGAPVNSEGEATYAALHLYRAAVERARTASVLPVSDALTEVEIRAPRGPVRIDAATRVSTAPCIIGVNSGKGTIQTHGDLGTAIPHLSGCPSLPR
jgi:urea transport system substrate-binding protein